MQNARSGAICNDDKKLLGEKSDIIEKNKRQMGN
jgi:hypothetical protein